MFLSDTEIRKHMIQDPKDVGKIKTLWENGKWDEIKNVIFIDPFKEENLCPASYDLSVGEEYISLRDPYNVKVLEEGKHVDIEPGETILILTREYLCLPRNLMAIIVPRARWIFEGASLNATKIEPTWYGKLLIGFTNLAKNPISLHYGEPFCTCCFMECPEVTSPLQKKTSPHLGRTKIGRIDFVHARQQRFLRPEEITSSHMQEVIDTFGKPWDVVKGYIDRSREEIKLYVEHDVAPGIVEEATSVAVTRAFQNQQRWFKILIAGLLGGFFTIIGLIITILVTILLKQA